MQMYCTILEAFFFFFQSLNSLNRANCSARANYLQSQIPQIQRKARGHRLLATENAIHRHKLKKTESNLSISIYIFRGRAYLNT